MKLRRLGSVLLCVLAVSLIALASTAQAQRPQRAGGMRGMGMPGMGGGGNPASTLLRREDVRKELELLDDQIDQLQELEEKQREQMREMFSGMQNRGNGANVDREALMQQMRDAGQELQNQVKEILLPHQAKRLEQLTLQWGMRGGLGRALGNQDFRQQLGITEDQVEKLDGKRQALEEKLRQKIQQLREEAQNELLSSLTPGQQAKFKEMVGKPFEFDEQPQGRGFEGFRQPGPRGGAERPVRRGGRGR